MGLVSTVVPFTFTGKDHPPAHAASFLEYFPVEAHASVDTRESVLTAISLFFFISAWFVAWCFVCRFTPCRKPAEAGGG